ncbi:MAG TPA: Uma2 family endonuclease [Thermoanaerobaculia bacterium]
MASRALAKVSAFEPLPAQGEWTFEDYSRLPDDGWRYEVMRGVLHMTPAPNWGHQQAVLNFGFLLKLYLQEHKLGVVGLAPLDVLLPGDLASPVQPDVVFISREKTAIIRESFVEGAPDLVLEVLSPSNWLTDRREKFQLYAEAGVREYWVADPKARTIEVFVLRNGAYELLGKFGPGERARSEVLPGFEPAIDEIFS